MNTWKVIFATLVIFGTGVVAGGLLVSNVDRAQQHHRRPAQPESAARSQTNPAAARDLGRFSNLPNQTPQLLRKDFLQNLDREVHLTSEQHERIEKIMSEGQEHTRALWEQIAPEIRQESADAKERISAVLTPEQRSKFEELMKQRPRDLRRLASPRDG